MSNAIRRIKRAPRRPAKAKPIRPRPMTWEDVQREMERSQRWAEALLAEVDRVCEEVKRDA